MFVGLIRFVTTKGSGTTYDSVSYIPLKKTDAPVVSGTTTVTIGYGNDWYYSGTTFAPGSTAVSDGTTLSGNDVDYSVLTTTS